MKHKHRCMLCNKDYDCWNPYDDTEQKCADHVTPICRQCLNLPDKLPWPSVKF